MKILIVDNYDSFTYNLSHYAKSFATEVQVIRNDALVFEELESFDKLIISPGPGLPKDTKNLYNLFERFHETKPILGVCLGMQGFAEYFGGSIINQTQVKHGMEVDINVVEPSVLFKNIPSQFKVGLYHSWRVEEEYFPEDLIITSKSTAGVIMSMEHRTLPIFGVQFHPESIMTEYGKQLLENFICL